MNKKEIGEIKKNINAESGLFTIDRVLMTYVDGNSEIRCSENKLFEAMDPEETEVIYETLKKVLGGSLGKNLTEYSFPNESYEDGGAQSDLYKAVRSGLESSQTEIVEAFTDRIRNNFQSETSYCIITGHCTYNILVKDKNRENTGDSDSLFKFIITAICPMETNTDGLYYNSEDKTIEKKSNTDVIVNRAPTDGFMYPVYSDKAADVNNVLVYTKSPKKPNLSLPEDVLDCTFIMTADNEKEKFRQIVSNVAGEELDYGVITQVNEIIKDVIAQNTDETNPTTIDEKRLRTILSDAGVSNEKLEGLNAAYTTIMTDDAKGFTASNLVESKTVVSTNEITINIGKNAADKLHTGVVGGRKCLIIDIDDPEITINGMETTMTVPNTDKGEE